MATILNSLFFNPSYITARYDIVGRDRSNLQRLALNRNFQSNAHRDQVSKQTLKKIRLGVQWLVYLADQKTITDPESGKQVKYRAGVLTLSLPTGNEDLPPAFFRDTLLPSFFASAKYFFNLENYIWKLERQDRGALHAHITIDQYLPWRWVQQTWCKLLEKHGLIEDYRSRFSAMSVKEYISYRLTTDSKKSKTRFARHAEYINSLISAFNRGSDNRWSLPNCTDIHSVKNVKNLAGYMCKYMSKNPGLGSDFRGRFWSCSHKLSKLRSFRVNLDDEGLLDVGKKLEPASDKYIDLIKKDIFTDEIRFLGCVYILKRSFAELMKNPIVSQIYNQAKAYYNSPGRDDVPLLNYAKGKISTFSNLNAESYAY